MSDEATLLKKQANIDALTENQVYADPIKKIQEEMLKEFKAMREQLAQQIDKAAQAAGSGGGSADAGVSSKAFKELEAENKKLRYRIVHLKSALDEQDGGFQAQAAGGSYKLYTTVAHCNLVNQCQVVAALSGNQVEVVVLDEEARTSKAHLKANPQGRYPLLEGPDGTLAGVNAICKHFSRATGFGRHSDLVKQAQIDGWVHWTQSTLEPASQQVAKGIFDVDQVYNASWAEASKDLKAHFKSLNAALEGKQWLVGDKMSLADVVIATSLVVPLQTVLDAGIRKAMKNASDWLARVYALPQFQKVMGAVQMCGKALKPNCVADPVKAAPKKEAKPAAAKQEAAAPAKPAKDNVQSLPATPFDVYDFKTFYVNHADKKGAAVDEWYKMLDWEGWAFWRFEYEKFGKEGTVLYQTDNLLTGFLSRAEHTTKYTFARMAVLGEEPSLDITGVWLCRGPMEIPDGLAKEHPQFEYMKSRKLDPRNNKADDTLVREYFGAVEGDKIEGRAAQTLRWHK